MAETQMIRCPACGTTNRVPREKIDQGLKPVCGRCKAPLPVSNKPVTVTDTTFAAEVERSPLPVLLDLWAAWCGPCRMIAPVLEELAAEMAIQPVDNLVERLAERVLESDGKVEGVAGEAAMRLQQAGGIGAVLRF